MNPSSAHRAIGNLVRLCVICATLGAVALIVLCATGCAVGFKEDGTPVAGLAVGEANPETIGEFFHAAGSFLPAPFNYIAAGVATLIGGGGIAAAARRRTKSDADEARAREDAAWDEAQRNANSARDVADHHYDLARAESRPAVVVPAGVSGVVPVGAAPIA